MRRIPAFVLGHVLGALVIGAVAGAFLDLMAVATFSGVLAANAVVSSLVCWWWPGLGARWWKLWPMATFASPLMVAALAWSLEQWDCLVAGKTGWSCMLAWLGPDVAGACLPSPLVGLAARWWNKRRIA